MEKINYCTFSPDKIFKIYIGDCCQIHDYHYQLDKKIQTRKETDIEFLNNLKNKLNKWYNIWIAYIYYIAVRLFCKTSWERWKYKWVFFGLIPIKLK